MGYSPRMLRKMAVRVTGVVAGFLRDKLGDEEFARAASGLGTGETLVADWEAERFAIDLLRKQGFRGLIVTEERGVIELGGEDVVALLDPLDGSKNYANGIPWCSVSLTFAERASGRVPLEEVVIAGAVTPVIFGASMSFEAGGGVYVDEVRVVRPKAPYPMIFAYVEEREAMAVVARYRRLAGGGKPVRSLGSAAMELFMVALGRGEAFIDARARLRVVDISAGVGALKEAGAAFSDILGRPLKVRVDRVDKVPSIAAAFNRDFHELIIRAVKEEGVEEALARLHA